MSNAFFKMRQSLLKDKKYGLYISTAIVEMVLIVLGILIALQIDTWNQTRQEKKIVLEYLDIIKTNVVTDLNELKSINAYRTQASRYTDTILGYYRNEHITNSKLFEQGIQNLLLERSLNSNKSAYESLKNSGYLRAVGNSRIEEGLNTYYSLIDVISKSEESFNSITLPIEENLSENGFYIEYMEMFQWEHNDTIQFSIEELQKYPDVQSTFIRSKMWLEAFIRRYTDLNNEGEELLRILNNED
jgi:hypothetical protein